MKQTIFFFQMNICFVKLSPPQNQGQGQAMDIDPLIVLIYYVF